MTATIDALAAIVGAPHVLVHDLDAYANDWRKKYRGRPLAVVKPGSTEEVAAVVRLCHATGTAIVPQAGNTGLVGGGVPDASGAQVVVNVSRMNRVLAVDTTNNTMTVEAGCILQHLQETAAAHGRLFPLSLAAEGSCEIGGNISTNAGGVQVLRYGNTRELVLGLEVVLPSGEVWNGLKGLRKDNTGYDLKHLFIGAEGTLGIVTRAVVKLFPAPAATQTAFIGLGSAAGALRLLDHMKGALGERITAFELISAFSMNVLERFNPALRSPLAAPHAWYVLTDLADSRDALALAADVEAALGGALEAGIIDDVVLAKNEGEARRLWDLRETLPEAQIVDGRNIKHDVSIPISAIADFIAAVDAALEAAYPGVRPVNFGHVGDGNLHYNVTRPAAGYTEEAWMADESARVNRIVHDCVHRFNGSISAEHGLGQLKRDEIRRYKSETELGVMRAIKAALDPKGIMNPGKVI
ncbi:MAG: FAD-binding oxidoreductase [Burkholderiales bacterium]|nr:FAD-binding oxidoreductase [Burkholderiales bacterium]